MRPIIIVLTALSFAFVNAGCQPAANVSPMSIQQDIQASLKPGDSKDKIIEFFNRHNYPYSYNEFLNRFESSVPSSQARNIIGVKSVIIINIYVDNNGDFTRSEVQTVNTYI